MIFIVFIVIIIIIIFCQVLFLACIYFKRDVIGIMVAN